MRPKSVLVVTGFTFGAQGLALVSQLVFAAMFGASTETDAFFAALALPLYVTSVLISSLGVVFVPVLVEYRAARGPEAGNELMSGTLNLAMLTLVATALLGALFAEPLLALSAPGLSIDARLLARDLAVVLWPSIIGSGLVALLMGLWQADSRFGWSSAVPVLGAAANLCLIILLGRLVGVRGAAAAWTVSLFLQALLLMPAVVPRWKPTLGLRNQAVHEVFVGVAPLVASAVLIRASTLLERFLGSSLPVGELSQVSYASRVVATLGVLVSSGPAAVFLPAMAADVASRDYAGLRRRTTSGLRWVWLVVAPAVALFVALSDPGARLVFEHGLFTRADAEAVASLLRAYTPSLVAVAFTAVTARALYALKATKVLAVIGAIEGLAYIIYTTWLAGHFGAFGIALGFSIYYVGSIAWQLLYLRRVLKGSGHDLTRSLATTTVLASLGGFVAWAACRLTDAPLAAVLLGGFAGVATYVAGIALVDRKLWSGFRSAIPPRVNR